MATITIATVSAKGWVVIPKEIREKYGIKPGDKVQVVDYGAIYIIPAVKDPVKEMRGMFKAGPSLTKALLAEREHEETTTQGKTRKRVS
jgi:AbrB family looped-hinge helix DNA binding protein